MEDTLAYTRTVHRRVARELSDADFYFARYAIFHEDMHGETFTYTRQTLGITKASAAVRSAGGRP
jgi:gamma-glutamyl hercynylcysteine S-oxide synthase